ncbi:MAG: hypothetical protein ABIR96_02200 [Bdellovibrionota bacterium]
MKKIVVTTSLVAAMGAHARPVRPFYQAGRALEMGDAYTAVGTDFEAVYYNPAGIARRTKARAKLMDLEADVSQGFVSLFSGSFTKFLNLQQILADTQSHPGEPYGLGVAFLPQFLIRNFSIGILVRAKTEATYNQVGLTTNMYSAADLGGFVHYGVALAGGIVRLGVGGKVINRAELDRDYTAAEITQGGLTFANQWKEGLGFGVDLGALVTLPVTSLPTFGVTIQDFGNTTFQDKRILFTSDSAPAGAPEPIEQKINVGYSMILKQGRGVRTVIAVDYKDVTRVSNDYVDHLHAGFEFNYANLLYLRGGVNEGRYWTAGLGVELGGMGIEFGSYGENIASRGAARVSDRKYLGRYVLAF